MDASQLQHAHTVEYVARFIGATIGLGLIAWYTERRDIAGDAHWTKRADRWMFNKFRSLIGKQPKA
jgi:hypothetical protein